MQEQSPPEHRGFKRRAALGGAAAAAVAAGIGAGSAVARAQAQPPSACGEDPDVLPPTDAYDPDLGPNTLVFDESTPAAEIQSAVDAITDQMRTNQFGRERHAVLLRPGTYAVDIDLRFYTQVAGLGLLPGDTVVDGHVRVEADWLPQGSDRPDYLGNATQNFWRSVENLAIRNPAGQIARWAVSQAAPFRRIDLQTAEMQLWDGYEGWASGGFFADSRFSGRVVSGSQQQFFTRNSNLQGGWAGSVWNMVFVGTGGAPAHHFPDPSHTVVDRAPVIREKPFLYTASDGEFRVFKPAVRRDAAGTSWEGGAPAGTSISLAEFYVVNPGEDVATVNRALAEGRHLLFTPGVHEFDQTLNVTAPGTVVLGLGLATIIPTGGQTAIAVADVDGAVIAGLLIDAGEAESDVLVQIGPPGSTADHGADPVSLHDLFARIGGAHPGSARVSLEINSRNVIADHLWLWRGDHGEGVGWDVNPAANGLVVHGDDVVAYGLFAEHYQEYQVVWAGERGRTYFFQNEMPYDPPDQASWRSGANGWASYKVDDSVAEHALWGGGGYCFFNVDPGVVCDRVFETPSHGGIRLTSLVSVSLGGVGTIRRVVNETGDQVDAGSFTSYVVAYP
ncbi:adenylyl cyclase [Glycomyces mayteni]|uniref:Adenylyl cyclase n=1 Tax=Glycomyces mayteni TaxID=543887 RepID=A0ABW2D2W0_9ACTN